MCRFARGCVDCSVVFCVKFRERVRVEDCAWCDAYEE